MRLHHRGIILVSCVLVGLAGPTPAQAWFHDSIKKTFEGRTGSESPWSNPKTGERGAITPTATSALECLVEGALEIGVGAGACRARSSPPRPIADSGKISFPKFLIIWSASGAAQQPAPATPQSSFNHDKQMDGQKTRLAIRAFQKDRGLPAAGNVTPLLLVQRSGATAAPTAGSTGELLVVCEVDPETYEVRLTTLHTSNGVTLPADVVLGAYCIDVMVSLREASWRYQGIRVFQVPEIVELYKHYRTIPLPVCGSKFGELYAANGRWPRCLIQYIRATPKVAASPTATATPALATTPSGATATQKQRAIPLRPGAAATPTPATTPSGAAATQEELNENAQMIYKECSTAAKYAQFHDCRCIERQYLDRGIMFESAGVELQMEIASICVNEAGVAAFYYPQCKQQFAGVVANLGIFNSNLEGFCTCYANAMVKNYAKEPSLYRQHLGNLTSAAFRSCKGS